MSSLNPAYGPGTPGRSGWEGHALRWLAYPANLAFAGVAGFLLALGVVTWLSAAVAVGRSLHLWLDGDDDRVFTNTFRELACTWRRTLPLSVAATLALALVVADLAFLNTRDSAVAVVLAAAVVPFAALLVVVLFTVPAAAALAREGSGRQWLVLASKLVLAAPGRTFAVLAVTVTWFALCTAVPTLVPVLGLSVPVFAGLIAARRTWAAQPPTGHREPT